MGRDSSKGPTLYLYSLYPPPLCAPQGGWSGRGKGRGAAAAACFGRSVLTAKQAHKCTLRPECTLYWPFLESTCLAVNHHARVGAQGR